ncbi:MAG: hypothetical protein WC761_01735 [Candidatus Paceibacterota bacterium]|jgi:hypothetical protein
MSTLPNYELIAQLLAAIATEMEKTATVGQIQSAKENNRTVRCEIARSLANSLWSEYGAKTAEKKFRNGFLEKNESIVVAQIMKLSNDSTLKDVERWTFNQYVENWTNNSEKEPD